MNIVRSSTEQHLKKCKEQPGKCLSQLLLDGVVIIAAYALLLWAVEGGTLQVSKAVKFYVLFIGLAFVLRYLDVDFQEHLTRVAGFQLGTKLFLALTG